MWEERGVLGDGGDAGRGDGHALAGFRMFCKKWRYNGQDAFLVGSCFCMFSSLYGNSVNWSAYAALSALIFDRRGSPYALAWLESAYRAGLEGIYLTQATFCPWFALFLEYSELMETPNPLIYQYSRNVSTYGRETPTVRQSYLELAITSRRKGSGAGFLWLWKNVRSP